MKCAPASATALTASLVPSYLRSMYGARRSEALYGLRAIYDAQTLHYATDREFADSFETLAFDLEGGAIREDGAYGARIYTYTNGLSSTRASGACTST